MRTRCLVAVAAAVLGMAACASTPRNAGLAPTEADDNVQGFFHRYDSNHDGLISRQEAEEDPDLMLVFDKADANHDEVLDQVEFRRAALLAVSNRRRGAAVGSGE
jgi:hypothetical protein